MSTLLLTLFGFGGLAVVESRCIPVVYPGITGGGSVSAQNRGVHPE